MKLGFAILLLATAPIWAAEDSPFDAPIQEVRPRIFLRKDQFQGLTIAKLKAALASEEYSVIRPKLAQKPLGRAILWMAGGKSEDLSAAIAGLRKMDADKGTWSDRGLELIQLATLFDWLEPQLDDATRKGTIAKLERAADAAMQHIKGGQAPYYYSRTPGALAGMTIAGIALKGLSPKADEYLTLFRQWGVKDFFKSCQWTDSAATGSLYTLYYNFVDLPSICAAWWSATGENPTEWIRANQGDWLDKMVQFYLWYMRPGFAFTDINDQYRDTWSSYDQYCQGLDIASYVTRSGYGREYAQRWLAKFGPQLYHTEYAHNFIFRDLSLEPRPLTEMPLAALFGRDSCGYGFFRSAWPAKDESDTATHVFFRCGDPMDVHGGVAAGEFQVFKHAPLAGRSGRYQNYDSPPDQYHRNCISTNVVLFTDPGKPEDRGDQRTRSGLKAGQKTWADWLNVRERNGLDVARILNWEATRGRSRCRADLTAANPPDKCKQWIREFVWLANKHLIVLDIVQTPTPPIRRQWQLHVSTPPQITDHAITVVNKPPDRRWFKAELQPKSDEARLICQVIEPKDYSLIYTGEGKSERFGADGKSSGATTGNRYHMQFSGRVVQIEPAEPVAQNLFLCVLTATEGAQPVTPRVQLELIKAGQVEISVDRATAVLEVPDWYRP